MKTDSAKIVKGLKCCAVYGSCLNCPYKGSDEYQGDSNCIIHLMLDTLSVLAVNVDGEKRLLEEGEQ